MGLQSQTQPRDWTELNWCVYVSIVCKFIHINYLFVLVVLVVLLVVVMMTVLTQRQTHMPSRARQVTSVCEAAKDKWEEVIVCVET